MEFGAEFTLEFDRLARTEKQRSLKRQPKLLDKKTFLKREREHFYRLKNSGSVAINLKNVSIDILR